MGRHRAEVMLWQAMRLRLQGREQQGFQVYEQALAIGLPPAQDAFVRALLADTVPKAAELLKRAHELDPFHHDATLDLVLVLVLQGKRDEARQAALSALAIFPEDWGFPAALAFLAAIEGKPAEMERWQALCARRMDPAAARLFEKLLRFMARVGPLDLGDLSSLYASELSSPSVLWELAGVINDMNALMHPSASGTTGLIKFAARPRSLTCLGRTGWDVLRAYVSPTILLDPQRLLHPEREMAKVARR